MFASIGSDLAKTGAETAERFSWDLPHFIAQVVSFIIVAICLQKFAFGPIQAMLKERSDRIAEGLAAAEKSKQELARAEALKQETLDKANAQANKMIEDARAAAARVQEQETQKAMAQAEQIITKAREATVMERNRMLSDLRKEVGGLVVQTTGQVIGKVLSPEEQQRLADEARRQLAA